MTSLRKPHYLKIYDIQSMLKYIFLKEKRPAFIQLKKPPKAVLIVKIDGDDTTTPSDGRTKTFIYDSKQARANLLFQETSSTFDEHIFKDIGMNTRVHINEHMELDFIYSNLLKSIEVMKIDTKCITAELIGLVERHDILHLFSYSTYIKSQVDFNEDIFKTFIRPNKKTEYFLVAIDCEMVLCQSGQVLGRLTILDHRGIVVYDKYVKPDENVIDYREEYSGLNEEKLSLGIHFKQLQNDILDIIGTNTCVLGHGLENDLEVLKLYVDNIIDTAYLFLSSEGYKVKLNQLSKKYLNEKIQQGTHCSHEDALCCLKLLAYKIQQIQKLCDISTPDIELDATVLRLPCLKDIRSMTTYQVRGIESVDPQRPSFLIFTQAKFSRLVEELPRSDDFFTVIFYEKDTNVYMAFKQSYSSKKDTNK